MRRKSALAVVTAAAALGLGSLAATPALAATGQQGPAQTTGVSICWHGPSFGSVSIGYCF
ncbi:MAG: hypothetical protein QM728_03685 [Gordonia sp. (in: high G+C Gram-positive bacteria)]|uniref:hypothetical protein n=1 Tax=Gordonia sp. (in: high G+C Gram-positive bacteria) TaxID=84139 RepID=UPI0039E25841